MRMSMLCAILLAQAWLGIERAADKSLPAAMDSSPCTNPPQIDGVIQPDEWKDAQVHACTVSFVRIDPTLAEGRSCELRIMNSANALYVALKVPDPTVHESLSPLTIDAAILALSPGPKLTANSDRKVVAPGLYRDKHFRGAGQDDGDDAQQDGLGTMSRDAGNVQIEWALPLQSSDKQDLQTAPSESIHFNITYFDGLQIPLTKTIMGGLYGPALDRAEAWGTLRLAKDVKDDGNVAFRGPAWIDDVKRSLNELAPARLKVTNHSVVPGSNSGAVMLAVTISYLDPTGKSAEAKAKIYLPAKFDVTRKHSLPLYFNAGYELPESGAQAFLNRNWIVVTPSELPTNPLIRLMNPDVALLHLARQFPWVDDQHVMIGGGSAGGWMTLMLSAETFPLAGAAPDVPPVNWGYNAAYFFKQLETAGPLEGKGAARIPALFAVGTMLTPSVKVHGEDFNDTTWFASSPIAHVATVTCPVSVYWSTADVLVPIDQIGATWVQAFEPGQFPTEFTMSPIKLMSSREGRLTLVEALSQDDYEIFSIPVPPGTRRQNGAEGTGKVEIRELPVSKDKQWSITIIDEGAPIPDVDHRKYAFIVTRNQFLDTVSASPPAVNQLTLPKLRRLMARYGGKEWLPSRLKQLDFAESERQDVLRGLRTYVSVSPAHAEQFQSLHAQLAADERRLEESVLRDVLK